MASNGFYPVKLVEGPPTKGWEIRRANVERECFGGETPVQGGILNQYAPGCDGKIHAKDLYVVKPDRRWATNVRFLCMWCAVEYDYDHLEGELTQWIPVTDEQVAKTKLDLQVALKEIHNLEVPGGAYTLRNPLTY